MIKVIFDSHSNPDKYPIAKNVMTNEAFVRDVWNRYVKSTMVGKNTLPTKPWLKKDSSKITKIKKCSLLK